MELIQTQQEEVLGIPLKESHFFDLWDVQYKQETLVTDFYCHYRNMIIENLKKKGDIILWQNSKVLAEDEQLSPTFEELILTIVLLLIDSRLPRHIKDEYVHLIGKGESVMDFKTEILAEVTAFFTAQESKCTLPKKDDDLHSRYVS